METIKKILVLIKELSDTNFTGQIVLSFYKGDLSEKIEKKEYVRV